MKGEERYADGDIDLRWNERPGFDPLHRKMDVFRQEIEIFEGNQQSEIGGHPESKYQLCRECSSGTVRPAQRQCDEIIDRDRSDQDGRIFPFGPGVEQEAHCEQPNVAAPAPAWNEIDGQGQRQKEKEEQYRTEGHGVALFLSSARFRGWNFWN